MDNKATQLLIEALNTVDGVSAEIHDKSKVRDFDGIEKGESMLDDVEEIPPFSKQTFTVSIKFEGERTRKREEQVESIIEKHDVVLQNGDTKQPRKDLGDEIHIVTEEIETH